MAIMVGYKTSTAGRAMIENFEGLDLNAYDDGTGTWTIGYGHTSAAGPPQVSPGMKITGANADLILANDLAAVETDVNRLVDVPINQNQFDALVSFHFNTGALGRSNVLADVNGNNFKDVPGDLLKWCYGGGRIMAGLVTRRKAEGVLFMSPVRLTLVATPKDFTVGTNAAMSVAHADINRMAGVFAGQIPQADIQQLVVDIVIASLNAVDIYRAANPPKGEL